MNFLRKTRTRCAKIKQGWVLKYGNPGLLMVRLPWRENLSAIIIAMPILAWRNYGICQGKSNNKFVSLKIQMLALWMKFQNRGYIIWVRYRLGSRWPPKVETSWRSEGGFPLFPSNYSKTKIFIIPIFRSTGCQISKLVAFFNYARGREYSLGGVSPL